MKYVAILSLSAILCLSACAEETFDSTCLGFSKSHWSEFKNDGKSDKQLCSCIKTELNNENVSDEGVEAVRAAMSNSIVMRNRFESELNKAVKDGKLSQEERQTLNFAFGQCLQGTAPAAEKEVNDMMQQFKAMQ